MRQLSFCLSVLMASMAATPAARAAPPQPKADALPAPPARPGRLLTRPPPCVPLPPSTTVRLDFEGATLTDLAREVGRALCKNLLVPRYGGERVTVIAPLEVPVAKLWETFLRVLAAHEMTVLESGELVVVIAAVDATRAPVPFYGQTERLGAEERMVTKVVDWKEGDLNAAANFLNIFKSPKGQIHPEMGGRTLVITDWSSSIARLERLIEHMRPLTRASAPRPPG